MIPKNFQGLPHKKKQFIVAAYSNAGWIEDPDGNHQSFNVFRWLKVAKIPPNMTSKDYQFVRSYYKFRTAKRALQNLPQKKE